MTTKEALERIAELGGVLMQDSNPEVRALGTSIFSLPVAYHEGGKQDMDELIFAILIFVQGKIMQRDSEEEQLENLLSQLNISLSNED